MLNWNQRVHKDNIFLKHIHSLPKIWMKAVTRALRHCLYINHLSQFARAIQIFGWSWIWFKNILSLLSSQNKNFLLKTTFPNYLGQNHHRKSNFEIFLHFLTRPKPSKVLVHNTSMWNRDFEKFKSFKIFH